MLGHHVFRNDAEAMAFAWMTVKAAWKPTKVRYKERTIPLERGQLAVSIRDMATAMDRDKAWVERLWKRLKSEAMIETHSEIGISVVTICNYSIYQGERDGDETPRKTPRQTGARQGRDTEQKREERNKEEGSKEPNPYAGESWDGWIEMRIATKKRPTDRAISQAITTLGKLAEQGHEPNAVLDQSTLNNWTGLFPVKEQRNGTGRNGTGSNNKPVDGFTRALREVSEAGGANDF
jgi:hypothetical protein